jgi:signal transduction histidine kinase
MAARTSNLSIRWRLMLVVLATSAVTQLFAGLILTVYDNHSYQTKKVDEIMANAAILASSVTAALSFGDGKAAEDYLATLSANPQIEAAGVYGTDDALFALYRRDGEARPPPKVEAVRERIDGAHLTVSIPVTEGGALLGSVYLRAAIEPIGARMLRYCLILLVALVGSLLIAVPISLRLNSGVSTPIREIADAASRVTAGDLNVEIRPTERRDEIGLLIGAFGLMVASVREVTGELERRVSQRTAELEAANKELEAFSYSVSHDLRAPLRAIDGFSLIMEEDYAGRLDAEGNRLLAVIRASSRKMGMLIDDLLAFSRLGRQAVHLGALDMAALIADVWTEIAVTQEKKVGFHVAPLPMAQADRTLIRQVWVNLLSNAAKYGGASAAPSIEVTGEEDDHEVVYRVSDNGAGFDMKYYDKLFGVFQRLHTAEEFPGTGVGLAIVQRIVVRHGGRVWAEGKVGEGATFFFSLPKQSGVSA